MSNLNTRVNKISSFTKNEYAENMIKEYYRYHRKRWRKRALQHKILRFRKHNRRSIVTINSRINRRELNRHNNIRMGRLGYHTRRYIVTHKNHFRIHAVK